MVADGSIERTLQDWVDAVCAATDIDARLVDVAGVLDLAKDAAHGVARPAAPLTTFLAGYLLGRAEHPAAPAGSGAAAEPGDRARAVLERVARLVPAAPGPSGG
jgi:hypothetical protein